MKRKLLFYSSLVTMLFLWGHSLSYAQQVTVTVGAGTDESTTTSITPFGTYYED